MTERAQRSDRVDAHHHLWSVEPEVPEWLTGAETEAIRRTFTVDDLTAATAGLGVTATVLVQTVHSEDETRDFLGVAADVPLIAAVTGWTDLESHGVADRLSVLQDVRGGNRLRAIRHGAQGEPDPGWLARPAVVAGVRAVGAAGLAYELLVKPPQLEAAAALVRSCPEVSFVLDHAGKPEIEAGSWEPWASRIAELAAADNLTCKLSGLVTEDGPDWSVEHLRRYVDHLLETFGPQRMLFGSDWPVCLLRTGYASWVAAADELLSGLSTDEYAAVTGNTARGVYRLDL